MNPTILLELNARKNTWQPPEIDEEKIAAETAVNASAQQSSEFLHIFQTDPYIDSLYVQYDPEQNPIETRRFTIHEGYVWTKEEEDFFHDHCVKQDHCVCSGGQIDRIYKQYSNMHPEWHLKRYYTKSLRVLDHIYQCLKKNTAKEMLYKSGLDEYAANIDEMEEMNLLAVKPSELYEGLTMRILRSLNCKEGVALANRHEYRNFLMELGSKFPNLFPKKYNDLQCLYLRSLINGELTVGETGRLFGARSTELANICSRTMYDVFMAHEKNELGIMRLKNLFGEMDPIYADYIARTGNDRRDGRLRMLDYLLLRHKEDYDTLIKRSNRKRESDWQERGELYYVRYPQTINDFCREAIYMQNCLLHYVEAMVRNDTTILFMRRIDAVNTPFITMEIFNGKLMQAYHRFNQDCTPEEAEWIKAYCKRHGIRSDSFRFDHRVDHLF